jgi:Glycosyltransferase family 28 C-terminal domain
VAHFLLAWELGANLGHATRLAPIARALVARGHRVTFAVRDVAGCHRHLGPELGAMVQAPIYLGPPLPLSWSMADVLLSCGRADVGGLGALAGAWRTLIERMGCDALVVDHAPTALLAARAAGVPALHVGQGFTLPPRMSPLPIFRDWAAAPAGHAAAADARALASANQVLAAAGAAPLPRLCDLFYPEQTMLCTWPELDHYAGLGREAADYRGPDCEFAPGVPPVWPDVTGPRVLAYLRGEHPEHADLLRALDALGCATECFMPDAAAHRAGLPRIARIHYSEQPIDLRAALPGCALVVCHAGPATVAQALLAGVPCLLLPLQAEQYLLARQVERCGAAVNAASLARPVDYRAVIGAMLVRDSPVMDAAVAVASRLHGFSTSALATEIAVAAEASLRTEPIRSTL